MPNANAYREGITADLDAIVLRAWRERSAETDANLRTLFELPVTRRQFLEGARDGSRVSPDSWNHAQWGMDRTYFRANRPLTLVVWGKNDFVFAVEGATAYRSDLPNAQVHLLDAGHFALETHADEIADRIRWFATTALQSS